MSLLDKSSFLATETGTLKKRPKRRVEMAVIDAIEATKQDLLAAAKAGAMAALTAQTVAGTKMEAKILTHDDILPTIEILEIVGEVNAFVRADAAVGRKAYDAGIPIAELLIGMDGTLSKRGWNCGACGFNTCEEFNKYSKKNKSQGAMYIGPNCNWNVLDFGIACSFSAAAISAMNLECRVQGSYGFAALALGHLEGCSTCMAITVGPIKESVWFDRVDLKDSFSIEEHEQFVKNTLPQLFVAFCGGGYPLVKHRPDWATEPKRWKETEDTELVAKQQDIMARVGEVIEREKAKRASD
jgi:uncharacterized ferredoxin-like protein